MALYSPTPVTPVTSAALESGHVLSTTRGTLFGLFTDIDDSAPTDVYYVQLVQGTETVPGNGALPAGASFLMPPVAWSHTSGTPSPVTIEPFPGGWTFDGGLVVVLSTTRLTVTKAAYAFFTAEIQ